MIKLIFNLIILAEIAFGFDNEICSTVKYTKDFTKDVSEELLPSRKRIEWSKLTNLANSGVDYMECYKLKKSHSILFGNKNFKVEKYLFDKNRNLKPTDRNEPNSDISKSNHGNKDIKKQTKKMEENLKDKNDKENRKINERKRLKHEKTNSIETEHSITESHKLNHILNVKLSSHIDNVMKPKSNEKRIENVSDNCEINKDYSNSLDSNVKTTLTTDKVDKVENRSNETENSSEVISNKIIENVTNIEANDSQSQFSQEEHNMIIDNTQNRSLDKETETYENKEKEIEFQKTDDNTENEFNIDSSGKVKQSEIQDIKEEYYLTPVNATNQFLIKETETNENKMKEIDLKKNAKIDNQVNISNITITEKNASLLQDNQEKHNITTRNTRGQVPNKEVETDEREEGEIEFEKMTVQNNIDNVKNTKTNYLQSQDNQEKNNLITNNTQDPPSNKEAETDENEEGEIQYEKMTVQNNIDNVKNTKTNDLQSQDNQEKNTLITNNTQDSPPNKEVETDENEEGEIEFEKITVFSKNQNNIGNITKNEINDSQTQNDQVEYNITSDNPRIQPLIKETETYVNETKIQKINIYPENKVNIDNTTKIETQDSQLQYTKIKHKMTTNKSHNQVLNKKSETNDKKLMTKSIGNELKNPNAHTDNQDNISVAKTEENDSKSLNNQEKRITLTDNSQKSKTNENKERKIKFETTSALTESLTAEKLKETDLNEVKSVIESNSTKFQDKLFQEKSKNENNEAFVEMSTNKNKLIKTNQKNTKTTKNKKVKNKKIKTSKSNEKRKIVNLKSKSDEDTVKDTMENEVTKKDKEDQEIKNNDKMIINFKSQSEKISDDSYDNTNCSTPTKISGEKNVSQKKNKSLDLLNNSSVEISKNIKTNSILEEPQIENKVCKRKLISNYFELIKYLKINVQNNEEFREKNKGIKNQKQSEKQSVDIENLLNMINLHSSKLLLESHQKLSKIFHSQLSKVEKTMFRLELKWKYLDGTLKNIIENQNNLNKKLTGIKNCQFPSNEPESLLKEIMDNLIQLKTNTKDLLILHKQKKNKNLNNLSVNFIYPEHPKIIFQKLHSKTSFQLCQFLQMIGFRICCKQDKKIPRKKIKVNPKINNKNSKGCSDVKANEKIINMDPNDNNGLKKECLCRNKSLVILQRRSGNVNFTQTWKEYKYGFGNLSDSFWIGLEFIYQLTKKNPYKLHIHIKDWDNKTFYADYNQFKISSEENGYQLFVKGYSGNSGDSLIFHNGKKFSTIDVDHDEVAIKFGGSCSNRFRGGWWYYSCYKCNPTGVFYEKGVVTAQLFDGISWKTLRPPNYSFQEFVMSIENL